MANTTTVNGVVVQVPYAILRNFRRIRPFTASVVGINPHSAATSNSLREFPSGGSVVGVNKHDHFVYVGDAIRFDLAAPCNDVSALAFDLIQVNPSSGSETSTTPVSFSAVWQRSLVATISAIDASSGAITFTVART